MTVREVISVAKESIRWAPEKEVEIKDILKRFQPYRKILGDDYELQIDVRASRDVVSSAICADQIIDAMEKFMVDRKRRCKEDLTSKYGDVRDAFIDGETETKIVGIAQAVLMLLCAGAFIFFIVCWSKNNFPTWFGGDKDTIYFILERIMDIFLSLIPIFVAVITGLINKKRIKKRYKHSDFTYEEKISAKQGRDLKPMRIVQIQIAIINNGNQSISK